MILKTLYVNGKIFTSNPEAPFAEAMAVSLGSVNMIGTQQEVLDSVGLSSLNDIESLDFEIVDLKGKTVIPTFVDANTGGEDVVGQIKLNREELLAGLKDVGERLSQRGFVGVAAEGTLQGDDAFEIYQEAHDRGFAQSVALYYTWTYLKNHRDLLEDKTKLIRNRKLHVAGIILSDKDATDGVKLTDEEIAEAIKYCRDNYCQLSMRVEEEDLKERVLDQLRGTPDWMEEVGVAALRLNYQVDSPEPFDILAKAVKSGMSIEEAITLYTKDAARTAGFSALGQLVRGGEADFIILAQDIFSLSADSLARITPEAVYIAGACVYHF